MNEEWALERLTRWPLWLLLPSPLLSSALLQGLRMGASPAPLKKTHALSLHHGLLSSSSTPTPSFSLSLSLSFSHSLAGPNGAGVEERRTNHRPAPLSDSSTGSSRLSSRRLGLDFHQRCFVSPARLSVCLSLCSASPMRLLLETLASLLPYLSRSSTATMTPCRT